MHYLAYPGTEYLGAWLDKDISIGLRSGLIQRQSRFGGANGRKNIFVGSVIYVGC